MPLPLETSMGHQCNFHCCELELTISPFSTAANEEIQIEKIRFRAFDMGGHEQAREIWRNYYAEVNAIIFMVDASDIDRLSEAKKELDGLLSDDSLSHVPVLVLGNKIDLPTAASEDFLRSAIGLMNLTTGKGRSNAGKEIRPIEVFMCSVVRKMGYGEGFKWLSNYL
jgi:GTP-binding protein SAR1